MNKWGVVAFGAFSALLSKSALGATPNILFIVSEDNGLDLGCYGNKAVHTPHLDSLASRGMRFTQAYVPYSISSPSRGVLFTGLYPHQNGQVGLATHNYSMYRGVKTLPKYMRELGYKTGCIGKIHVNPESEIPFDFWENRGSNFAKKNLKSYAEQAVRFVKSDQREDGGDSKPFFLMVNFPDAHFPVQASVEGLPSIQIDERKVEPMEFVGVDSPRHREYVTNYYNCMNRLDESVGMLLDSLKAIGALDNTIIIYISDHGAQFPRAKGSNYEAALKIPMIVCWAGHTPKGAVDDRMISTVDMLPTFIAMAGGTAPAFMPGCDLRPVFEAKQTSNRRKYIFAGGMGSFPQVHYPRRSVRSDRYKLIVNYNSPLADPQAEYYRSQQDHYAGGIANAELESAPDSVKTAFAVFEYPPRYELYDLKNDPNEYHNLASKAEYAHELENLKQVLQEWQKQTKDPVADPKLLARWNSEVEYVMKNNVDYRAKDFRWGYLDYFSGSALF